MADGVSIKLKVTGSNELDALIKKLNEGRGSLNDLTQAKKLLNQQFKATDFQDEKWKDYAGNLAVINDKQRDVRLETKAGHEAYFKAGLEVRQLALSSGLLTGELGKLNTSLGNSVLNAVQLKQMLVPLGVSMSGFGIAAVAAVSALPALVSWFISLGQASKKAFENTRKLNEEMKKTITAASSRAAERLFEKDPQKALSYIDQRVKKLREAVEVEYGLDGKALFDARQRNFEREQEVNRLLDARITLQLRLNQLEKDREKAQFGKTGVGFEMSMMDAGSARSSGQSLAQQMRERNAAMRGKWKTQAQDSIGLDLMAERAKELATTLKQGADQFASTLINALVQGRDIAQSIGLALLGIFVNYATAGIGGMIYDAIKPTGGGKGGDADIVNVSSQRGGRGGPEIVVAQAVVKGGDLLILMKQNSMRVGQTTY